MSTLTEPSALNGVTIAVRTSPSTVESLRQRVGQLAERQEDRVGEGRVGLDRVEQDVDRRLRPYREGELPEPLGRLRADRTALDRGALIESVKKQAVMIFGAAQVTLLRDEAYNFLQLGAFLERADNTARILDVKFHLLRPDGAPHADSLDYFAWSEVLACIGAVRTYRRIYRSALDPIKVAELMMLRRDVPRSVHHCLWMADLNMQELAEAYGARGEADRLSGELHARLRFVRIDQVFEIGLAKFLGGMRDDIALLSDEIGRQFLLD